MQYRQYILPLVPGKEGNFQIRLNPIQAFSAYKQLDAQTLFLDKFSGSITPKLTRRMSRTDYTGTPKYDSLSFNVYDPPSYTGREGDPTSGTLFSEDLTDSNGSLFDRILSDDNQQCRVYVTYIPYDTGIPEPFFCGEFDPKNLPRNHSSVRFADDEDKESQLRTLEINCTDVLSRLSKVTFQDVFDAFDAGSGLTVTKVSKWYAGTMISDSAFDYPTTKTLAPARYDDEPLDTTGSGFYRGLTGITIGNLISAFCTMADFVTFSGDIDSAFDFYGSTYNGTTKYTPYKFTSLKNLYILLNYWMGKGILSGDPEDFQYGNSWGRDKTGSDLFLQLMNQFGTTFYGELQDVGSGNFATVLQTLARNKSLGEIPTNWQTTRSSEKPRQIGKTSVTIQNSNDGIKLLAGANEQNSLNIEIPFRAHPFGAQTTDSAFIENLIPENFTIFDKKMGDGKPQNQFACFRIWKNDSGAAITNVSQPSGWGGSTFLFAYASDVSGHLLYHFSYPQDSPEEAMIAAIGCIAKDSTFPTDNDGSGYYNTLKAPAELYYKENIGNRIILEREYHGITDDNGKLQTIRPGLEKYFPIRTISNSGNNRLFRSDEIEQDLIAHSTKVTYKEVLTTFPPFALKYIGDEGGTSNSGGNSISAPNNSNASIDTSGFVTKKAIANTQNNRTTANDIQISENILEGTVAEGEISLEISNTSNDNVNGLDADNKAYLWFRCITDGSLSATTNLTGLNVSQSLTLAGINGQKHFLLNQSGFTITIKHNNSNSDERKRLRTPDGLDFAIPNGYFIPIRYKTETDPDDSRWEVISEPIPISTITGAAHTVLANLTGSSAPMTDETLDDFANALYGFSADGVAQTNYSVDGNRKTNLDYNTLDFIVKAVALEADSDSRNRIFSGTVDVKPYLDLRANASDIMSNPMLQVTDSTAAISFRVNKDGSLRIITANTTVAQLNAGTLGYRLLRFVTTASNDDPASNFIHGKVSTTNNTAQTYATIDCSITGSYIAKIFLKCRITGGTGGGTVGNINIHEAIYQIKRSGGTTTANQISQVSFIDPAGTPIASSITFAITGGSNVELQFKGNTNTNFTADALIIIMEAVAS